MIRDAVQNLQKAMKAYKSLMTESAQKRIDTVIKFGSVISEACHIFSSFQRLMSYSSIRSRSWHLALLKV
jgi:hypothetical protein